ncbi:MAG: hypothetical protein ACP5H2_05100 [Solirubrobacteraceae bacterium]
MGHLATARLFQRLDGGTSEPTTFRVPIRVVIRGFGEIQPATHA